MSGSDCDANAGPHRSQYPFQVRAGGSNPKWKVYPERMQCRGSKRTVSLAERERQQSILGWLEPLFSDPDHGGFRNDTIAQPVVPVETDGEIKLIIASGFDQSAWVINAQRDIEIGMLQSELGQHLRQHRFCQVQRNANAQALRCNLAGVENGLVIYLDKALRIGEETLTRQRQGHGRMATVEDRRADGGFKTTNLQTDRGL